MFKAGKSKAVGKIKKNGKTIYATEVKVKDKNAGLKDVHEYIEKVRNRFKKKAPEVSMSVAIKYKAVSYPMSGRFVGPDDELDLTTVYDYADGDDEIETFYVQYTF